MKVKVWHVEWLVNDEDYIENLGGLVDDNHLPYTPKDLGLPAYDKVFIIEVEPEKGETVREAIARVLNRDYLFPVAFADFDYATELEPAFRFY